MINKTLIQILAIAAAFVFSAWLFSDIFLYLVISIVIATILRPLTNVINRLYIYSIKMPRVLAILVSFIVVIGVISAFMLLFIPLIVDQINVLSELSFEEVYANLSQPIVSLEKFLIHAEVINPNDHNLTETIRQGTFNIISSIEVNSVINNLVSITGGFFISMMAISFITFFLLYENGLLGRVVISVIPNKYFELYISAIHKIENLLSNYLIGLTFQMLSIFTIAGVGLTVLGVKYALTIALFAALANLIPYLGPLMGSVFGILVGVSTTGHFAFDNFTLILIAKIGSVFGFVQIIDNVVLQPLIFSKSVKAHPLEIFVVIFAAASLAGITGMVMAIPAYTIVRVSFMEIRSGFKSYKVFQATK
ncbi:AI-2E family transporter [Reichenbachiella versicolor]|uniref:AI-2E family transporter n=1 Tax=Reichenbachiella versicolor TaxID=1821036 RepID=UPI000D6E88F2|nr:AI-2E family transporter [Reichenbachiella versicolor]